MKKVLLSLVVVMVASVAMATDLTGKKIYINPGHGSYGANDRPCATIPYPNLPTTGMPDTCGFYESNTDLWKCLYLRNKLEAAGATVLMSRTECGPWDYEKVNGDYPSFTWSGYQARSDYEQYNRRLSEICEEVEANGCDMFISVHSNAATEGTTTNYPLFLYRGYDNATTTHETASKAMGTAAWAYRFDMMEAGIDPSSAYSKTLMNVRGDINFYGSSSTRHSATSGNDYTGYLGVLKHGTPGGLWEGYFHTYQPARHRALNHDYCHQEGLAYYRGMVDYFNAEPETVGYIMGTVKDLHQKIDNPLFKYAPKSNDQWLPCNGAMVTLKQGATVVATYTVDQLYNGIFVFENLQPGNYTVEATCEGYKAGEAVAVTVTANKTSYLMMQLEDENYEAPTIVYETYPAPEQGAYLGLAGKYEFGAAEDHSVANVLAGKTIRRALVQNDSVMFVLAVDDAKEPTLLKVDPRTASVVATLPTDLCTVSANGMYKLSDIALTAEGILVGCSMEAMTFTPSNLWHIYKWTEEAGVYTQVVWLTNTTSETCGNYYNAMVGSTMAFAGSMAEGIIYTTTYTTGSATHGVRFPMYTIADGNYAGAMRNQIAGFYLAGDNAYGENIDFIVSPNGDNRIFMASGEKPAFEWQAVNKTAQAPTVIGDLPENINHMSGFKFAGKNLVVGPKMVNGKLVGVSMYDITNGADKAVLVKNNIVIDSLVCSYATVKAIACGEGNEDMKVIVVADSLVRTYKAMAESQPTIAHVNAYGLNLAYNAADSMYTFTFTANAEPLSANLVFYQLGKEAGKTAITAHAGVNNVEIKSTELPIYSATEATWAVELNGEAVGNFGLVYSETAAALGAVRLTNTVDNNPESEGFQRIYLMNRAGGNKDAAHTYPNGQIVLNPDYTRMNADINLGGQTYFASPARPAMDKEGTLYIADWGDQHSGIYVATAADPLTITTFFEGTQNSSGVWTNSEDVAEGSSTPGCFVYGEGADTKLVVYNEDASGTLPANGLCIYNIGQPDGTIAHTWNGAPSAVMTLAGQANTEGNVWACEQGIWVSQNRSAGNNNAAATSLRFYTWDGECTFSSHMAPRDKDGMLIINGSIGSCFVYDEVHQTLLLNETDASFMLFDVAWTGNIPTLTLRYTYKHWYADFRQFNYDYAGNLIASGPSGLRIFSMPTEDNHVVVPAKKALTVVRPFSGAVEAVVLDKEEVTIVKGATETLVAQVVPDSAKTLTSVVWGSSNEAVATVANGVVTAVASGVATITAYTTDSAFHAVCQVTVITPVTSVALDQKTASITLAETVTLAATVNPTDADNKNVTWSVVDETVATVVNGVVTPVAVGETQVVVTTVDGEYRDTCVVTVLPVAVTGVELNETTHAGNAAAEFTLVATVLPANATNTNVSWTSDNEEVAHVEQDGSVVLVGVGTATITVTTEDGNHTASCVITVSEVGTGLDAINAGDKVRKIFRDGQVIIIRGDEEYMVNGLRIK